MKFDIIHPSSIFKSLYVFSPRGNPINHSTSLFNDVMCIPEKFKCINPRISVSY